MNISIYNRKNTGGGGGRDREARSLAIFRISGKHLGFHRRHVDYSWFIAIYSTLRAVRAYETGEKNLF